MRGLEQNGAAGGSQARAAILLNDGDGDFSAPLLQSSTDTLAFRAGDLNGGGLLVRHGDGRAQENQRLGLALQ